MNQPWLQYAGILIVIASIMLVILLLQIKKDQKKYTNLNREYTGRFYLVLYRWLSSRWLFKRGLSNIRVRLVMTGDVGERHLRKRTVQIYLTMVAIVLLLLILVSTITKQVSMVILMALALWFLSETLVDIFVVRLGNQLLKEQVHLNDMIRHKYYESGMVDEAIYEACQALAGKYHVIGIHGQRIYDVLNARDVDQEISAYNETAPNKFLRMLLGLAYMTMEYGDGLHEGSSVFMKNLSDLTSEIRIELSKREKIVYALSSLNVIALLPLFCIAPIRHWAEGYFMPLKTFYSSQSGYLLEITTIALVFLSYLFLRRLQRFEIYRYRNNEKKWLGQLYTKGLKVIVDWVGLLDNPKVYMRLRRRLRDGGSQETPEAFATMKCMYFMFGLICGVLLILGVHFNQTNQIYNAPTLATTFLGGQLTDNEMTKALEITRQDNVYLEQMTRKTSKNEVLLMLEAAGIPSNDIEIVADRLLQKQQKLYREVVQWWQVLLILIMACLFYQGPEVYLVFQKRLMSVEIEDEVAGFGSIILMLMHHERLTAEDILEWLELYAVVLQTPISNCLNNYASGPLVAMEELKLASDNDKFQNIVHSLQLAVEDLSVVQAFDELASDKVFYIEERKTMNERIIEKKVNLGHMFGFLPVYGMILLYMVIPMITVSIRDLDRYFIQLSGY